MKCNNCGAEFSEKVLRLHQNRCPGNKVVDEAKNPDGLDEKELTELKQIADEKGIQYAKNIGKVKLLEKIRQGAKTV